MFFGLLLLLVPRAGHANDVSCWVLWGSYILEQGLGNVYQLPVTANNYNPLYHYILWLYGLLMGSPARFLYYAHWLKGFTLLFDFAGALWAASLVRERERRFGLVLLLLFNIGYLYNTLIWEQVDAIYTFFAFGALVLAVRQRLVGSVLCLVLALLAKTQAIIFVPPLLLLWAPRGWHRPGQLLRAVLAGGALSTLLLAPFIWFSWENYLPRIIEMNTSVTAYFPVLSVNAYNFWHLIRPDSLPMQVPDTLLAGGLRYRTWGLLLFLLSSALALLPLALLALRRLRQPPPAAASLQSPATAAAASASASSDLALTLLSCGLLPLLLSFFLTQMHERYWHAAVLLLAAYGFVRRDYLLYGLVSVAYFLNLEGVLQFLKLQNYKVLVFQPWFVAALFALAIVIGLIKLYRLTPWRRDWQLIRQGAGAPPAAVEPPAPPRPARAEPRMSGL